MRGYVFTLSSVSLFISRLTGSVGERYVCPDVANLSSVPHYIFGKSQQLAGITMQPGVSLLAKELHSEYECRKVVRVGLIVQKH